MRNLLALPAAALLATFAPPSLSVPPARPARPVVTFVPVPLDLDRPERRRVGKLLYLGGWAMRSNDPRFGGISALRVSGGEALALSDVGYVLQFGLPRGGAASALRVTALEDGPTPWHRKRDRDTESMAFAGNSAWVGYEIRQAIWRYRLPDWRGECGARPAAMRDWPTNEGAEAMLRLGDGRFLIFSEGRWMSGGTAEALLFDRDPTLPGAQALSLRYRPPAGFKLTDVAQLPDGRLLYLNRRFGPLDGLAARLTVGALPRLVEGAVLESAPVAELRPPLAVDNMEALAVSRDGARTILWLASDDNHLAIQRSLLLKFALVE